MSAVKPKTKPVPKAMTRDTCPLHEVKLSYQGGTFGITGDPYLECPQAAKGCAVRWRISEANLKKFPPAVAKAWVANQDEV